jgi:hypothetical protein
MANADFSDGASARAQWWEFSMRRDILVGVALLLADVAHAQELKCEIEKKYVCEASDCKAIPATVWNVVNTLKHTYARCDPRGCDIYEARIFQSGIFMNIEVTGS